MPDDSDDKWKYLFLDFTHDVSSHLTTLQGYADMMVFYLEKLARLDNVPSISMHPELEMTPETALKFMRIIQERATLLQERKNEMSQALGFGVEPFKGPESS